MIQVDYTLHVSDLAMVGAGVLVTWRAIKWAGAIVIEQRDFNRDISALLRGDADRPGIVRDVRELKRDMYEPTGSMNGLKKSVSSIKLALARSNIDVRSEE